MTNDDENPFKIAHDMADERQLSYAKQSTRFFILACFLFVLGASGMGYGIWAGARTQFIPYVVAIDDLGKMQVAPRIVTIHDIPEPVFKRELADFVRDWRSIPMDYDVLYDNVERVLSFLPETSVAAQKMREYGTNELTNFFARQEREVATVDVISVTYGSGSTWIIQWDETVRDKNNGRVLRETRYQGAFATDRIERVTSDILLLNPLGLMITDFDVQQISE